MISQTITDPRLIFACPEAKHEDHVMCDEKAEQLNEHVFDLSGTTSQIPIKINGNWFFIDVLIESESIHPDSGPLVSWVNLQLNPLFKDEKYEHLGLWVLGDSHLSVAQMLLNYYISKVGYDITEDDLELSLKKLCKANNHNWTFKSSSLPKESQHIAYGCWFALITNFCHFCTPDVQGNFGLGGVGASGGARTSLGGRGANVVNHSVGATSPAATRHSRHIHIPATNPRF